MEKAAKTIKEEKKFLIDNWSYSSLTLFLSDGIAFKKRYILKIYNDDMYSPAAIVGRAAHKCVEDYFKGFDIPVAKQTGLKELNSYGDGVIDYGKTGSPEKLLKDYNQATDHFFAEVPDFWATGEVLGVEEKITTFISYNGIDFAIPAKSHTDFIHREKATNHLNIHDWKFVSAYTKEGEMNWKYIIQAMFNYHTVKSKFGENPHSMTFWECKISKNTNGDQQLQPYTIVYGEHPEYFTLFYKLYDDCTKAVLSPSIIFLPNPNDMFNGDESMTTYLQGLIESDLSDVEVSHKQEVKKFVKKNFHESVIDKVENKHLTDEEKIREKLAEFGVPVEMTETYSGCSVILYTMKVSRGVKMKSFEQYAPDIALALKVTSVRVLAPIPGTDRVGIEVPNPNREVCPLPKLKKTGKLILPIGVDAYGKVIEKDLAEMPHLLIAGSTGSGKSIAVSSFVKAIIMQNTPETAQLVLIDPKRVELSRFKKAEHLLTPIIHNEAKAMRALKWVVEEMEERYNTLEEFELRSVDEYNELNPASPMSKIVVVIDEFADLMLANRSVESSKKAKKSIEMVVKKESLKVKARALAKHGLDIPDVEEVEIDPSVEELIVRLAQKSRAVGIHLIIATQRPSVDVITGIIKANLPTRIAFRTTSKIDSNVILDQGGSEELLGKGDMLFLDPSAKGLQRLQGFFY